MQVDKSLIQSYEPIIHQKERLALYPILHTDIWNFYKKHMSAFWTSTEIDYSDDMKDWEKLSNDERYYIEMVLGFFAGSDFIVNEHLCTNFIEKIKILELQIYYRFQAMMEDIHSNTYADLINAYVKNNDRKEELFNAVQSIECIKKKAEWAKKYIYNSDENENESNTFIRRMVVFSVVEGVFFSGSFCAIFWLKKRGLMPGLTFSNELISRDEGLHRDMACHIYKNHIVNKLNEDEIINIVKDGVDIEKEFVTTALPVELLGMNSLLMREYIEFVADHLLYNLIGKKYYNTQNPFPWMTLISLESKGNFFETRVNAYAKGEIGEIIFDSDF